ncbi:zinc finger ZZ-type and EF-hand domain-containing protein 1-like [Lingula anatina]|uniref:Zinc finger ZZ-type and EF-hand domain-containing protein 1-like n=1 Tax=Lingula anatina TaxID=7574 RepID=A0A1S3IJR0_LINAN|nr:zinc finger ZZ-type and EF-hand domain-containing protein 1-like [Lingula anatina]|eukprot:XP_013398348.1 zinc finger ZZ-type and EF-hand domain-containing protein 1-like [Lingula anatina]
MHHISSFIGIVRDLIIKFKKGDGLSVEKSWVLSLALKSLLQMVKSPSFQDGQSQEVFTSDVIQCLVQLASQGTGFSKQWLLKDLEVLSLMLYTQDKEKTDVPAPLPVPVPAASDPRDPWQGLDEPAKMCFQTLHEHFHVPIPILRAIYDMHGQNTNALLMAVQENIEGDSYNPSEGIKKLAKKWESGVKAVASEVMADKAIDAGILQIDLAVPVKRTIDKATEEPSEDAQKLIKSTDNDTEVDVLKQRRSKSASLLKKELEVQGKTGSREYLKKVNLAMSILWARKVLLSLLADWPQLEYPITSDLLGCRSNAQIPCVLDLLNRSECKQTFRKVVNNVIQHCESSCLPPIASTACQFMEEVTMATNVRQSEHPYEGTKTVEEKIHIPGAAFLSIKFDSKCATEEDADEVVMASTADYKQDKHVFSGNSKNTWKDFDMAGDTLYFKFTTEGGYSHWGYKFTISSGKIGRFDTGYLILNAILSNEMVAVSLPLNDLWCSLVYVACKQTGTQRLKTIQLLLRILQTQFVPRADPQKCRVDLTLLKPLWKLYKSSFKDTEGGSVTQPIVRALTELFLVAENTALDLGIVEEYVVALFDLDEIRKVVYQGLHNVAALGAAIGLPNKATEVFQSIKPKAKKT